MFDQIEVAWHQAVWSAGSLEASLRRSQSSSRASISSWQVPLVHYRWWLGRGPLRWVTPVRGLRTGNGNGFLRGRGKLGRERGRWAVVAGDSG